ncbi:MAG: peptidase C39 [Gammaproteobacteria bacterium AqS3]|nr:peptidase C39 [Gammaproteobacteria bacterium AqS3]
MRLVFFSVLLCLSASPPAAAREFGQADSPQWMPSSQIKTWREFQRERVEMQDLDYSCGAAALATLLREFYGVATNEADVLQWMGKQTAASLADLASAADTYGFRAVGLRMPLPDLLRLKIPAIVHLVHRGEGHFSVVNGVRADGLIALADPSWGNRQLLRHQFVELWDADGTGEGKVLLIVPKLKGHPMQREFFRSPEGAATAYEALRFMRHSDLR